MSAVHPQHGWRRWFAMQWGLLVVVSIVVGIAFWLARHALTVVVVIGCIALVVGCVVGMKRLERWVGARDEGCKQSTRGLPGAAGLARSAVSVAGIASEVSTRFIPSPD